MKKSIVLILTTLLLSGSAMATTQQNNVTISSYKPVMTCNSTGEQEILVTIQNNTSSVIDHYSIDVVNNNKIITGISYNENIKSNSSNEILITLPEDVKDVNFNISDYEIIK